MRIVYWSDYACPYCYIAEARLHRAIAALGIGDSLELMPRAFELDPGAPAEPESDTLTRFARKYRLPMEQAKMQIEHISTLGREVGLDFRYATTQFTNTFDAHRLMKYALSRENREVAEKTNQLLFDAYFTKNLKLADHQVLLKVGLEAGLPEAGINEVLESGRFGDEVRADEREAARLGVHGVPYFIFPNGLTVPGAISEADFRDALLRSGAGNGASGVKGSSCGPDGCKVSFD